MQITPGSVPATETKSAPGKAGRLQNEVAQHEQAMESRAVIDQAVDVLVAVGRITPAEAWDVLRETSMCTNIKLWHVAELIAAWGRTGNLVADVRDEVSRRLAAHMTDQGDIRHIFSFQAKPRGAWHAGGPHRSRLS